MRDRIVKMIPEIDWIQDKELREKVVATIEDALKTGGWEPEDMDKIPFTLLIPDCPASLNVHNRGVTRMAKVIYEEYNPSTRTTAGSSLTMTHLSPARSSMTLANWWSTKRRTARQ